MVSRVSEILNTKIEVMSDPNTAKSAGLQQIHKIIESTNKVIINNLISIKATRREGMLTIRWKTPLNLIQRIETMMPSGVKDSIIPSINNRIKMKRQVSKEL